MLIVQETSILCLIKTQYEYVILHVYIVTFMKHFEQGEQHGIETSAVDGMSKGPVFQLGLRTIQLGDVEKKSQNLSDSFFSLMK